MGLKLPNSLFKAPLLPTIKASWTCLPNHQIITIDIKFFKDIKRVEVQVFSFLFLVVKFIERQGEESQEIADFVFGQMLHTEVGGNHFVGSQSAGDGFGEVFHAKIRKLLFVFLVEIEMTFVILIVEEEFFILEIVLLVGVGQSFQVVGMG